jgi:ribose 5-phosphate isomerase A
VTDEELAWKRAAAEYAAGLIESGMRVGLGTGSTAIWAVRRLAERLAGNEVRDVMAVPTSRETEAEAARLGVPLTTLADHPVLDLTIDGADEVDPRLDLVKGGGGALLHEKVVAQATRREVIVVDATKCSPVLGTHHPLPIEVLAFGWRPTADHLEALGAEVVVRRGDDGQPIRSEEGNLILDCTFGPIADPAALAADLSARAAIVEHGLFLGLTDDLVVAGPDGIRHERAE